MSVNSRLSVSDGRTSPIIRRAELKSSAANQATKLGRTGMVQIHTGPSEPPYCKSPRVWRRKPLVSFPESGGVLIKGEWRKPAVKPPDIKTMIWASDTVGKARNQRNRNAKLARASHRSSDRKRHAAITCPGLDVTKLGFRKRMK
jgi:hypothetical protein